MEDDQALHMELMQALRAPQLRPVSPSQKPVYVGGTKQSSAPDLLGLQAEFLQNSIAMQKRLRPQLERMTEIKNRGLLNNQWRSTLRELRSEWTRREEAGEAGQVQPRLLYQLEQTIQSKPGWKELQKEIKSRQRHLDPVEYEGFYIIKNIPGTFCNVK